MIREICKAGWLQQKIEKRSSSSVWTKQQKTIFLPEKWYVFCNHDDRLPLLEVYSTDEGVSRHEPLETMNLSHCLYISVAIEDDRTFVITFQSEHRLSVALAALSALERREWMEILRFKLTQLGCLDSGANIYTSFPVNITPLPSSGNSIGENSTAISSPVFPPSSTSVSEERAALDEPLYQPTQQEPVANDSSDTTDVMAPISGLQEECLYEPISHVQHSCGTPPSAVVEDGEGGTAAIAENSRSSSEPPLASYAVVSKEERPVLPPRNGPSSALTTINRRRQPAHREGDPPSSLYDVPRALLPPLLPLSSSPPRVPPHPRHNVDRYDELPFERELTHVDAEETIRFGSPPSSGSDAPNAIDHATGAQTGSGTPTVTRSSFSFDNPGFAEDEDSGRRYANGPIGSPFDEEHPSGPYSALPGRTRMVPWSVMTNQPTNATSTRANSVSSASRPTTSTARSRSQSVADVESVRSANGDRLSPVDPPPPSPPLSPPPAPPLPLPNTLTMPIGTGRMVPVKEAEVERLRSEMDSPLHVKVQLLIQHVVSENGHVTGLAMVDLMGFVWIAGWLKRLTKQFSAAMHVGDRIDSILDADGKAVAVNSVGKAEQVLKECWKRRCRQVSLFIKRLPLAQVYVLKRAVSGENVGIVVKAGKNEIISIEQGKPASQAGMTARCDGGLNGSNGLVNYFITEVNGRPLHLFAKDHEAQKRLNAVGTEITVLVQPSDFVKELRKKLKHKKGHKDYVVG